MTSEEATDAVLAALSDGAGEIEVVIVHEQGCACEDEDTCDCEPEHRVIEHEPA